VNDGFTDIEVEQDESLGYWEPEKSKDVIAQEVYNRYQDSNEVQEKSFIKNFYVIKDLNASPMELHNLDNIGEAIKEYEALPNDKDKIKALGIESRTGALDFVHCINGQDKLVQDYMQFDKWKNNIEVYNVVQNIKFHFATKAAENILEVTQKNDAMGMEIEMEV